MFQKFISAIMIIAGLCLAIVGYLNIVDGQKEVDQSFQSAQAAIQQKGKQIPLLRRRLVKRLGFCTSQS